MQTNSTMTVLTSTQMPVKVSKPTRSALTVADKTKLYGDLILWTAIPGDPYALLMESPISGKIYKVELNTETGSVRCSCPCTSTCFHMLSFKRDWVPSMMATFRANRPSVYSQNLSARSSRPAISDAQRMADFG